MLQKKKKKASALDGLSPKGGRGRPRKHIDPKAFDAFEAEEADLLCDPDEVFKPSAVARQHRRMNPATGEQNYSEDEIEFMNALSEFKRASGRTFPTCSEILGVLRGLGYKKDVLDC